MDEERIDVADSEISRCHALPARAAVAADAKSGRRLRAAISRRGRAIDLAGVVGGNQHAVCIGIDVVDRRPRLAAIRALEKAANLDSDMDDVGIFGVKSDPSG